MKLSQLFLRNISINFFVQSILIFVSFISVPYLIRTLGMQQYGLWILINTFIGYVQVFGNGITSAQVRFSTHYLATKNDHLLSEITASAFVMNVALGLIAAVLLSIGGLVYSLFFFHDTLRIQSMQAIGLSSLFVFLFLVGNTFWAIPQALQRFELVNIKDLLFGGVQVLGFIIIASLGGSVVHLFALTVFISVLYIVIFFLLAGRLIPFRLHGLFHVQYRKILSFAAPKLLTDINGQIVFQTDRPILSIFIPLSSLPYYAVPLSLVQRATFFVMNIVPVAFPMFTHAQAKRNPEKFKEIFAQVVRGVNFLTVPIFLYLAFFAKDILTFWISADFAKQATTPMQLLSIAYLIYSMASIPSTMLEAIGKPHIPAILSTISAITQILLFIILIPRYGILGTSLALLINSTFNISILYLILIRTRFFSLSKLLSQLLLILITAMLFSVVIYVNNQNTIITIFIVKSLLIISVYTVMIWFLFINNTERNTLITHIK